MGKKAILYDPDLDETMRENVRLGYAKVCGERKGESLYQLTPKGVRYIERLLTKARSPSTGGGV